MARQIRCVDTREEVRSYEDYLRTKHWKNIKNEYSKRYERECVCCGEREGNLHLHHLTYERIGNEEMEDLVYLCKKCHMNLHRIINSTEETSVYAEWRRNRKKKVKGGVGKCCSCIHHRKRCELGYDCHSNKRYCPRFAANDYVLSKEEKVEIKAKGKNIYIKPDGIGKIGSNKDLNENKKKELKKLMEKKKMCM